MSAPCVLYVGSSNVQLGTLQTCLYIVKASPSREQPKAVIVAPAVLQNTPQTVVRPGSLRLHAMHRTFAKQLFRGLLRVYNIDIQVANIVNQGNLLPDQYVLQVSHAHLQAVLI